MSIKTISVDQLCVGLYILLDVSWLEHSFVRNSFLIKNNKQIQSIKSLGIKTIRIETTLCTCKPLDLPDTVALPEPEIGVAEPTPEELALIRAKKERIEKLIAEREAIARCEKEYQKSATAMKDITRNLFTRPEVAVKTADELTQQMVGSMLAEKDIAIHLMNDKIAGEETYYHSLNVAILSMMLAKELKFQAEDIRALGMGCLFHDIGKVDIPDRIVNARHELSKSEQNLLQQHCLYGVKIGERIGLPKSALDIILQHHEYADGSGYPSRLSVDKISMLSRIVCIVNAYDNLCNRPNSADSLTPYDALVMMFTQQRKLFDAAPLNIFIHCMGIYPPGTVVKLSDGSYAMVVSANPDKALKPTVLIYDPSVPKDEAIILDLGNESGLEVQASVKPALLPQDIYAYLSPRKRMTYYFDPQKSAGSSL
jgi:putative nucleotidyltransferase with HDIG domain